MRLAVLPIDSRPCNTQFVHELVRWAGAECVMPPAQAMDDFHRPAPYAMTRQFLETELSLCDAAVISLDHWCFGGLLASRDDQVTTEEALLILHSLTDSVSAHLRSEGAKAGCVAVIIRSNDRKNHSRQRTLQEETDVTAELYQTVAELFGALWDRQTPLRLLGVSLTHISKEEFEQTSLFADEQKEKQRKVDQTMDALRERFGMDAVVRGSVYGSSLQVGRKYRAKQEMKEG